MHFFFTCSILLYKQHHICNKHCTFRQLTLPTAQLGYLFPLLTEDLMQCRSDRFAICDLPYVVLMLCCSENSPYSKHFWPKSLDALGLVTPQDTSPPHSPHPQHCFDAVKLGKTCSAGSPSVPLYLHSLGNVVRRGESKGSPECLSLGVPRSKKRMNASSRQHSCASVAPTCQKCLLSRAVGSGPLLAAQGR